MIEAGADALRADYLFDFSPSVGDLLGRESSSLGFEITSIRKRRRSFARAPTAVK
jgi:hypothetical protein